ncbi:MAG: hypothetical protein Q8L81_15995 [Bacteroidota bacterium]|nr:hypothetical protein [Bacteroidota bacterium]
MKKTSFILILVIVFIMNVRSQNNANTFDFWIGKWDAYWADSLKGTNILTKTLNDLVIEENFSFNDRSFLGRSWSMYDSVSKVWNQTWVDDAGAYLLFKGGKEGDNVVLSQINPKIKNNTTVYMRMVFSNIKKNSFDWDWQSSVDNINWKSSWAIKYKRKL